ncbi:hypothetical protein [Echinicola vietnamensis]|uniref:Long-chain fatty acid transport protein n=1 Tax=Echinicola vietnamensis (strain DSM 17526 / LMG 23754 / KMM 6221) TaxID=926556 RepID=L0G0V1_ECHVK|nr:hypothetical protein [Echinicola vietnamensis]AGA78928.1 hypothetical protein Echvi_2688 [Echinicola vietnamensis DSM 17526]
MHRILRIFCCSVCFLIFQGELFAQRGNGSLYSSYGVGLLSENNFGQAARLSGSGIAARSPYFLNYLNPANGTSVTAYNFMADAQIDYKLMNIRTSSEEITINRTNLSLISLWFRTSRKSALGFGIMPMTSVDYSFVEETYFAGSAIPFDKYINGYGNINKVFANYAFDITSRLTLGVRPYFAFGHINHEKYYDTDQVTSGSIAGFTMNNRDNYKGIGLDAGIQYVAFKKGDKQFNIGAAYEAPIKLTATPTTLAYLNETDSVLYEISGMETSAKLGNTIKGGLAFQNKKWLIAADYSYKMFNSKWENYTDSHRFSIGAEILPNFYSYKFLNRMNFSAGLFYDSGYIKSRDTSVGVKGASLGFGLPIQGFSRVSLSYQYQETGSVSLLSKEVTHGITLNLNIADIWFQKPAYK